MRGIGCPEFEHRDPGELPSAEDQLERTVGRVLEERQHVDVVRREDVPAIRAGVSVFRREIEGVLRDVDRIAIVGRVRLVAAERVVERERTRRAGVVPETREQPVVVAPRRRRAQRDRAVALIGRARFTLPRRRTSAGLRVVDVDRPDQMIAVAARRS